jgi:hypothetical protein
MADVDGILQLEFSDELGKVVGIGVQVVALPGLARTTMAAAIMGDTAIAARGKEKPFGPRRRLRSTASHG